MKIRKELGIGQILKERQYLQIYGENCDRLQQLLYYCRKENQREGQIPRGKFGNESFVPVSIEGFRYVQNHSKRLTETQKSGGPRLRKYGKKIASRTFFTKAILAIRDQVRRIKVLPNLPAKDRIENFKENAGYRNSTLVRGLRGVPFLRHRLNERAFPSRREGRSEETKTKQFTKAGCKIRSTSFENHKRNTIRSGMLQKLIKKSQRAPGQAELKVLAAPSPSSEATNSQVIMG